MWLSRARLSRLRWLRRRLRRRRRSRRGRRLLRCRSHGILGSGYWLSRRRLHRGRLSRVLRLGWSLGCRCRGRLGGLRGLLRRGDRSRINRLSRLIRLSLGLIHTHVVDVHGRASRPIYASALVIISKLGRINKRLIRPILGVGKIVAAHHLVQLQGEVVLRVDERVRTFDVTHLHAVCELPIEVELDRVSALQHTIGMELALRRGRITVHHALMLLSLLGVTGPRRMDIAHEVRRVVALGLEHVNFTVTRPSAQLFISTGGPEGRPRRTRSRKLDARLSIEATGRRSILRGDHARRERRIISSIAALAHAWDLRAVPLGLHGGVPGSQVQITISHRDVIWRVCVLRLRSLTRIEATILIAPLRGIEGTVELIAEGELVATCDGSGQPSSARGACRTLCPLYSSRRGSCSRHGHHCNRCTHRYSQSCHHRQLAQARSLRSGRLTRDLHRDRTSLSCCIGLVLVVDHWRLHAKTEQTVNTCRPVASYRSMYPAKTKTTYMLTTTTAAQTPGHRLLCPGVFHLALSVLYCLTDQRWIIRGHESATHRHALLGFS